MPGKLCRIFHLANQFKRMIKPKYLRIRVDDPCAVPWEGMTPVEKHERHCASCDRVITDFSQMSDDEIILHFTHNKGKICGRFAQTQLNRPMPLLPAKTQPARWWRTLLLLPLTLFSKNAKAQYYQAVNGSEQAESSQVIAMSDSTKQEEPIVPADAVATETITNDSLSQVSAEPAQKDSVEIHVQPTMNPEPVIWTIDITEVNGGVSATLGLCSSAPADERFNWRLLDLLGLKDKKEKQQFSSSPDPEYLTTEPEKKPEPQTPGVPASSELSAILPEQRRRFWKQ